MNGKLIMMTMAGILNTMIGIATAASAVLLLNSWEFLFVGALFVRGGTWTAVDSTINRRRLASR